MTIDVNVIQDLSKWVGLLDGVGRALKALLAYDELPTFMLIIHSKSVH